MSTLLEMQTKQGDLESDLADLMPKIPADLVQKLSDLESMLGDSKLKLEALEGLPAVQEDWEKQLQEVCMLCWLEFNNLFILYSRSSFFY